MGPKSREPLFLIYNLSYQRIKFNVFCFPGRSDFESKRHQRIVANETGFVPRFVSSRFRRGFPARQKYFTQVKMYLARKRHPQLTLHFFLSFDTYPYFPMSLFDVARRL